MKRIWILIFALCFALIAYHGCEIPYTGHLGPEGFNGWVESEENGFVCLWNGFDRICVQSIPGPPGKDGKDGEDGKDGRDGKDGKDGQTLIAIREVPVEVIVEKIVETVVVEEIVKEVPVEIVVERVVTEYVDREVPIEVFVERTVEIIRDVIKEVEVPVEVIKEVEVPVEVIVIREVPIEKIVEVIKTVYVEVPNEPEFPVYIDQSYVDWEKGDQFGNNGTWTHPHVFKHSHGSHGIHQHKYAHRNGVPDDTQVAHRNLAHD